MQKTSHDCQVATYRYLQSTICNNFLKFNIFHRSFFPRFETKVVQPSENEKKKKKEEKTPTRRQIRLDSTTRCKLGERRANYFDPIGNWIRVGSENSKLKSLRATRRGHLHLNFLRRKFRLAIVSKGFQRCPVSGGTTRKLEKKKKRERDRKRGGEKGRKKIQGKKADKIFFVSRAMMYA